MSYPSSIQNSCKRENVCFQNNKQNMEPNFPTRQTNSPDRFIKHAPYSQMPSGVVVQSVQHSRHLDTTQNSLRTIFRHFSSSGSYSSPQRKYYQEQSENFMKLLKIYTNKNSINTKQAIKVCEDSSIYMREEVEELISDKIQTQKSSQKKQYCPINPNNLRSLLLQTDLGLLKVQYLCQCLLSGDNISSQQQKLLQFLIDETNLEEITPKIIWENYHNLSEQIRIQTIQLNKIASQYNELYRNKIMNKVSSQHIRLELLKSIQQKTIRQKISYNSMQKVFNDLLNLNKSQSNLVFKYIYSLQSGTIMNIIDPSKQLNSKILIQKLLSQKKHQKIGYNLQQINKQSVIKQLYENLQLSQRNNLETIQQVQAKDKQIDRLNRMVDMLEVQNQQILQASGDRLTKLKLQNQRRKYEQQIQKVQSKYKQQQRLTKWYQAELEALMKSVNKQHIMRRYLLEEVPYTKQQQQ